MNRIERDLAFTLRHQVQLNGTGVVRWRGTRIDATYDHEQRLVPDGTGDYREKNTKVLVMATASVPENGAREDAITVDGASYKVRSIEPRGDGRHTEVLIADA